MHGPPKVSWYHTSSWIKDFSLSFIPGVILQTFVPVDATAGVETV